MTRLSAFRTQPPETRTRDHISGRAGRAGLIAGLVLVLAGGGAGCDASAKLFKQRTAFTGALIVSAFPGKKKADGSWERVCSSDAGPVSGLLLNAVLQQTQLKDDLDISIRPGDTVETRRVEGGRTGDITLSSADALGFQLDCIDPQPHPNASSGGCQGVADPSAILDRVRYVENTPDRKVPHNVMVLVDMSGSMVGLVDSEKDFLETTGSFTPPSPLDDVASDFFNERLVQARRLTDTLNTDDRLGILGFGEELNQGVGLQVPCADAVGKDVQAGLEACFGRNRDLWTNRDTGISSLKNPSGRSNLWKAVKTAYDFMKGRPASESSNHIIVLTDGPDTCIGGEAMTPCKSPCSNITHDAFMAELEADRANPNAPQIHVHFIQWEALGYGGRDPRQVEASCVSGGHYQYINSNDGGFPKSQNQIFNSAVEQAVLNVRFALMGHWEIAAEAPAYVTSAPAPAGSPAGSLYALSGKVTISTKSNMVTTDRDIFFDVGQGDGASQAKAWDRRPTVLKPCAGDNDCGGTSSDPCNVLCSEETKVCPGHAAGITLPDNAACEPGAGGSGFCCSGSCKSTGSGQCAPCAQ